jgi:hypothetical protein
MDKKITTYTPGALRQFEVTPDAREERLGEGLAKVEVTARGGDVIVAVGSGPQDLDSSGYVLMAGESRSVSVQGQDIRIAAAMLAIDGVCVIQVLEFTEE